MSKFLFTVLLMCSLPTISWAQYWTISYKVSLTMPGCPADKISNGSSTSYFCSHVPGGFSSGTFDATGRVTVSARGSKSKTCCYDTSPLTGCETDTNSGSLTASSPDNGCPTSFSEDGVRITFDRRPIPTPTVVFVPHPSGLECKIRATFSVPGGSSVNFQWQVTDNLDDPLKWTDFGLNSSTVTATVDELFKPGFTSKFSRRWVRVVDPNCRSVVSTHSDPIDFHISPPEISVTTINPTCHDKIDGKIIIEVSPAISAITDFKFTMYRANDRNSDNIIGQCTNGKSFTFTGLGMPDFPCNTTAGLPLGDYYIEVQNNTSTSIYGSCVTALTKAPVFSPPSKVEIDNFSASYYNGYNIACKDGTGSVTAIPKGGTGVYANFVWKKGEIVESNSAFLSAKIAGSYDVSFTDSKGCLATGNFNLTEPPSNVTASIVSVNKAIFNGRDVSCRDKSDGLLRAAGSGGVGGYSYQWTGGPASTDYPNVGVNSYSVTVRDANNCIATQNYTVVNPPAIDFVLEQQAAIACAGTSTGAVRLKDFSIGNAIGSTDYSWSTGETTSYVDDKPAGTYTLTINDDQNCSASKSISLVDPPAFTASIIPDSDYNGSKISCNGGADGALRAVMLDHLGTPRIPNSYAWYRTSDLATTIGSGSTKEDLNEGSYTLIVDYNLGCKAQNTYMLNDPDPVAPIINPTSNYNGLVVKCTADLNGSIRATRNGGTGAHTYIWNDADNTTGADLVGIGAGTYLVTATDANGCVGSNSYTVVDASPVTPSIVPLSNYNGFVIKCFGESNGSLRASAVGGTGGIDYTYAWDTGVTVSDIAALPAGTYTVTATDKNGCSGVKSITIENPEAVLAMAGVVSDYNGFDISCHGAGNGRLLAIPYGGTSSYTYLWSNGSTSISPSGLVKGTYTLTVTDTNGCTAEASTTLSEPEPVVVLLEESSNLNGVGVSCKGSTNGYIKVGAAGGTDSFTFEWLGETETSSTLSNAAAGTYQVIARDGNGCSNSLSHTITEPTALTLATTLKNNVECFGASTGKLEVAAAGGVANYEYSLDNVNWKVSHQFSGLRAQDYTVYVRDLNLCVTPLAEILTEPSELVISFTDIEPAFCADPRGKAKANITGGVGAYRYEWRNSSGLVLSNINTINNVPAGAYTLTSHDGNDCPMQKTVAIVGTDGPQSRVAESMTATCSYTSDGSATVEVYAGDGPFTYRWPDGQTTPFNNSLAKGKYAVEVKDRNDCVSVEEVEIDAPDVLEIYELESLTPACFGDCNGMIKVATTGGTGIAAYNWGATVGDVITGVCKGSYTVQAMDANGCVANKVFVVSEPEPLEIKLMDRRLPKCYGGCDGMIAIEASGGNGGYQYEWNTGSELAIADGICAGNHAVSLIDARGCMLEKAYLLGQPELLVVRLLANQQPDCHDGCNGKLEVDAIGGVGSYSYQWSEGTTEMHIEEICPGYYTVTVRDANSCVTNATYNVTNPPALLVDLGGSITLCVGQMHTLDVSGTWVDYLWRSNTGLTSSEKSITISKPGQYWIEVHNSLGCVAQDTFLLETSLDLLKASFLMPKEALTGDTVVIIDVSWPLPDRIEWGLPAEMSKLLDMGDVIFGKFSQPGEYSINLNTHLGECFDEIAKSITILENTSTKPDDDLGFKIFVREFTMYPNPTQGNFSVKVELTETSPITLSVWSTLSGRMLKQINLEGKENYNTDVIMESLIPGAYVLRLDHAKGRDYIRFIVH